MQVKQVDERKNTGDVDFTGMYTFDDVAGKRTIRVVGDTVYDTQHKKNNPRGRVQRDSQGRLWYVPIMNNMPNTSDFVVSFPLYFPGDFVLPPTTGEQTADHEIHALYPSVSSAFRLVKQQATDTTNDNPRESNDTPRLERWQIVRSKRNHRRQGKQKSTKNAPKQHINTNVVRHQRRRSQKKQKHPNNSAGQQHSAQIVGHRYDKQDKQSEVQVKGRVHPGEVKVNERENIHKPKLEMLNAEQEFYKTLSPEDKQILMDRPNFCSECGDFIDYAPGFRVRCDECDMFGD